MVDCTTNSYAHHRPIPPWTVRTGRRDIARGRTYSRLGRGPGGVTDLHAARPTRGGHHCREVPRKDDTTATFSLRLERAKWAEIFFRLMHGILNMGLAVRESMHAQYPGEYPSLGTEYPNPSRGTTGTGVEGLKLLRLARYVYIYM